jgi:hypothetical protein
LIEKEINGHECQRQSLVTGLSKPLDHNEPFEFDSANKTAEVKMDLHLIMQEKLAKAIDEEINSNISSKSRTTKDVTSMVKKELAIFEVKSKRGANLESCYKNFNSIPPSSVEPEVISFRMWKNCYQH